MQWVNVRCCVELLLMSVLYNAFAGCNSLTSVLEEFKHFDDGLKQPGTLLALSLRRSYSQFRSNCARPSQVSVQISENKIINKDRG
jgi:hypothetical protein